MENNSGKRIFKNSSNMYDAHVAGEDCAVPPTINREELVGAENEEIGQQEDLNAGTSVEGAGVVGGTLSTPSKLSSSNFRRLSSPIGYSVIGDTPVQQAGYLETRLNVTDLVGQCHLGRVWEANCPYHDETYALKTMEFEYSGHELPGELQAALREVKALSKVNHQNVLRIFTSWVEEDLVPSKLVLFTQTELYPQSVLDVIKRPVEARCVNSDGCFCVVNELNMLIGVLSGLTAMHERKIIHGHLNPCNIFIGPDEQAVISDWDMCRDAQTSEHSNLVDFLATQGFASFQSPEQLNGHEYSFPADVFAASLIFLVLCDRNANEDMDWSFVLDCIREGDLSKEVMAGLYRVIPHFRPYVAGKMCAVSPADRPAAASLLKTANTMCKMHQAQDHTLSGSTIVCSFASGSSLGALLRVARATSELVGSAADAPEVRWTDDHKQCEIQFQRDLVPTQVMHIANAVANEEGVDGVLHNGVTHTYSESVEEHPFPRFQDPSKFAQSKSLQMNKPCSILLSIDVERGTSMKAFESMVALLATSHADLLVPSMFWSQGHKKCCLGFQESIDASTVAHDMAELTEVVSASCNGTIYRGGED